jgi:hypothetical protein
MIPFSGGRLAAPEVIVVRFHTLFDDRSSVSNRIAR